MVTDAKYRLHLFESALSAASKKSRFDSDFERIMNEQQEQQGWWMQQNQDEEFIEEQTNGHE